jgi:hypothetical protein
MWHFVGSQISILLHLVFQLQRFQDHLKGLLVCLHLQEFLRVLVAVGRKAPQVLVGRVLGHLQVVERMVLVALRLLALLPPQVELVMAMEEAALPAAVAAAKAVAAVKTGVVEAAKAVAGSCKVAEVSLTVLPPEESLVQEEAIARPNCYN